MAEAVIIVPVLVLLTMLIVQLVLIWHGRHAAQAAAQAAARSAAAYQASAGAGQADGQALLAQVAPSLLRGPQVAVSREADQVAVSITADVLAVVPFARFTVTERAAAPVEAFTAGTATGAAR